MDGKRLNPIRDPNSIKYPDRVFYAGEWRTHEQIETRRERDRETKRERYQNDPEFREAKCERDREVARERRVHFMSGGIKWSAYVDNKAEVQAAMHGLRANQKEERRGFNETVA